ncbi:MAG TPA: hypothetical protein VHC45_06180, partial [Gaiellaceae bacterium]|nr:hypothetical protein [Gaiellaceae bacterium]
RKTFAPVFADGSGIMPAFPALMSRTDSRSRPHLGGPMARKTIFVSDFSNKEIADEKQSATITVRYGDGRRGIVVADAHVDDQIVKQIAQVGRSQSRRGRRPKSES